ncbi:unnamed protein product [Oikopleura dioica]|uniref:C-type lectin domain-containing protein n=1 Tax=Oikopleura dioica TaxID=34765 RepID=E4YJ22_OIKDI|nr:unnamed protein product [Oikopleura dioica]
MATAYNVIKGILVTIASLAVWYFISTHLKFELDVVTALPSSISEIEYLRKELRIQTENVARLANAQATVSQATQYQTLEKRLSESSKRHVETKSKLTKIEKSFEKTKNIAIDTLASFDEFLGTQDPDSFVETYGVGEFVKSINYVFKELRKHLKNSSGTNLLVSDSRLRYSEAQAACRDIGAQLVTILDEEKMQSVLKAVAGFKRWDIWIGLNRLNKKKYEWDTGEDLQFSSWGDGQPNWRDPYGKDGEEECVIMWSDATWHDYNCRVRAYFVCEIPIHEEGDILKASKIAFDEKNNQIIDKSLDQQTIEKHIAGQRTVKSKYPSTISEKQKIAKEKASNVKSMEAPKENKSKDGRINTKAVYDDSQNKAKLTDPEYRNALVAEVEKQRKEREENKKTKQSPQTTKREDILEEIMKLSGIKKGSTNEKKLRNELNALDDEELELYLDDYDEYYDDYEDYDDYDDYEDYDEESYVSEP